MFVIGRYVEYGFISSTSKVSCILYEGPPHGGETNTASHCVRECCYRMYLMRLLEKVRCHELNFLVHSIEHCIVLCTGDFDRIYIYRNDCISQGQLRLNTFVEILGELNGITPDLWSIATIKRKLLHRKRRQ